jgi:hypothetical protein
MERIGSAVADELGRLRESAPTKEEHMSVVPQAEPTTETVSGTVAGIIAKPPGQDGAPRWQIEVQPEGSQYTKKVWSKDAEMVGQINMLIGQPIQLMCGISHWTTREGQPTKSLWLNGYGVPGAAPAPATPVYTQPAAPQAAVPPPVPVAPVAPPPAPQAPPHDVREEKIHRQTASKVAVQLLPFLTEDQRTFTNLITISERLVAYYETGMPAAVGSGDPGPEPGLSPDDENIPF